MTDSPKELSDGIDYIPATIENTLSEEQTSETSTTELYLNMEPLQRIASGKTLRVPKNPHFTRKDVVNSFQQAFELIGGVPRLALWANENQTEFYKLYSRLLPSQASSALGESNIVRIEMSVPRSPLDEVEVPHAKQA